MATDGTFKIVTEKPAFTSDLIRNSDYFIKTESCFGSDPLDVEEKELLLKLGETPTNFNVQHELDDSGRKVTHTRYYAGAHNLKEPIEVTKRLYDRLSARHRSLVCPLISPDYGDNPCREIYGKMYDPFAPSAYHRRNRVVEETPLPRHPTYRPMQTLSTENTERFVKGLVRARQQFIDNFKRTYATKLLNDTDANRWFSERLESILRHESGLVAGCGNEVVRELLVDYEWTHQNIMDLLYTPTDTKRNGTADAEAIFALARARVHCDTKAPAREYERTWDGEKWVATAHEARDFSLFVGTTIRASGEKLTQLDVLLAKMKTKIIQAKQLNNESSRVIDGMAQVALEISPSLLTEETRP
jgi:hypothetical protein